MPNTKQTLIMKKISAYLIALLAAGACFVACDDDDDDPINRGLYDATPAKSAAGTYSGTCNIEPIGNPDILPSTETCTVTIAAVEDNAYAAKISINIDNVEECPWEGVCNIVHTSAGFDLTNFRDGNGITDRGYAMFISNDGEMSSTFTKTVTTWTWEENPFTGELDKTSTKTDEVFTFSLKK